MPNPYYVEPRSNILAEPTRQAMQLLQMKQASQLGQAELSQKERHYQGELPLRTMQAETAGVQAGTARIGAETAATIAGIAERKDPYYVKPINQGKWTMFNVQLKNRKLDKAMEPLSNFINSVAESEGTTPVDLYVGLQRNLPMLRPQIKANLQKELEKAVKDKDVARQGEISEWINTIGNNKIIDSFFPGVAEFLAPKTVEATLKPGEQPTLYKTAQGFLPAGQAVGLMPPTEEPTPITDIQKFRKKVTIGETRTELSSGKDDPDAFESLSSIYNTENKRNEVAYWKTGGMFTDEETKFIKLSKQAVKAGWTPTKVQEAANAKGMTVEAVLKELGLIK